MRFLLLFLHLLQFQKLATLLRMKIRSFLQYVNNLVNGKSTVKYHFQQGKISTSVMTKYTLNRYSIIYAKYTYDKNV